VQRNALQAAPRKRQDHLRTSKILDRLDIPDVPDEEGDAAMDEA
jgi:hypothetical protein